MTLPRKSDFYGAMDGASKFVKGDAIAGILILVINIIGGLIIGLAIRPVSLNRHQSHTSYYQLATAWWRKFHHLMLAIATAIIVTRVSTTQDMAENIGLQIGLSRAWLPVSAVLLLMGFIPGMPNTLFLTAALFAGAIGYLYAAARTGCTG